MLGRDVDRGDERRGQRAGGQQPRREQTEDAGAAADPSAHRGRDLAQLKHDDGQDQDQQHTQQRQGERPSRREQPKLDAMAAANGARPRQVPGRPTPIRHAGTGLDDRLGIHLDHVAQLLLLLLLLDVGVVGVELADAAPPERTTARRRARGGLFGHLGVFALGREVGEVGVDLEGVAKIPLVADLRVDTGANLLDREGNRHDQQRDARSHAPREHAASQPAQRQHTQQRRRRQQVQPEPSRRVGLIVADQRHQQGHAAADRAEETGRRAGDHQHQEEVEQRPRGDPGARGVVDAIGTDQAPARRQAQRQAERGRVEVPADRSEAVDGADRA